MQLRTIISNRDSKAKFIQFTSLTSALEGIESGASGVRILHSADQPRGEVLNYSRDNWNRPPTPQINNKPKKPMYMGNQDKRINQAIGIYNQGLKVLWKPNSIPMMPLITFPKQSTLSAIIIEDRTKASTNKKSTQSRGGMPVNHKYKMYATSKRLSDNAVSVIRKGEYKNAGNSNRSTRSAKQLASI